MLSVCPPVRGRRLQLKAQFEGMELSAATGGRAAVKHQDVTVFMYDVLNAKKKLSWQRSRHEDRVQHQFRCCNIPCQTF